MPKYHDDAKEASLLRIRASLPAGFLVLDYQGYNKPVTLKCSAGHESVVTTATAKRFTCPKCHSKLSEYINKLPVGYILLSYTGSNGHCQIQCPAGHLYTVCSIILRSGKGRCLVCDRLERQQKLEAKCVVDAANKGWDWFPNKLSPDRATIRCKVCGTTKDIEIKQRLKYLKNCNNCRKESIRLSQEGQVKDHLVSIGYTLLEPYRDTDTPFLFKCEKDHTHKACWTHFQHGGKCGASGHHSSISQMEIEVVEWLRSVGVEISQQTVLINTERRFKYYLEVVGKKLLIEMNGLYYHSMTQLRRSHPEARIRGYHLEKLRAAETNGYRLFQFWEDEWKHQADIVKSMVLSNTNSPLVSRVFARNCQLVEVSNKQAKEFHNEHHLQGSGPSGFSIGLARDSQLLMVVSTADHHRGGKTKILSRLTTRKLTRVVGGASRLISHLPRPLTTWSDNRFSAGGVYKSCGFRLDGELRPDYFYTKNQKRFSKQSLKKTSKDRESGLTEWQLRELEGYNIVFDAGKVRWVLD